LSGRLRRLRFCDLLQNLPSEPRSNRRTAAPPPCPPRPAGEVQAAVKRRRPLLDASHHVDQHLGGRADPHSPICRPSAWRSPSVIGCRRQPHFWLSLKSTLSRPSRPRQRVIGSAGKRAFAPDSPLCGNRSRTRLLRGACPRPTDQVRGLKAHGLRPDPWARNDDQKGMSLRGARRRSNLTPPRQSPAQ
jgi:hypothetical protein